AHPGPDRTDLGGPDGSELVAGGITAVQSRRGLQSRGAVLRTDLLVAADPDRRRNGAGGNAAPRLDPSLQPRHTLLPGLVERDVRQGAGGPATGGHPVLSEIAVRSGEGVRPLDHGELPGELRDVRGRRDPLQSRVTAPGSGVRNAEGDGRGGPDQARVGDRKSTRLNSSHVKSSYAVFCLKKKKTGSVNRCR